MVGGDGEGPDQELLRRLKPQGITGINEVTAKKHHTALSTKEVHTDFLTTWGSLSFLARKRPGNQAPGEDKSPQFTELRNQLTILE